MAEWTLFLEPKMRTTQSPKPVSVNEPARSTGMLRKILLAANFVGVSLLILVGHYMAPPEPTITSTCQMAREVEYCHWSHGGYSMTMPDGAVYTRGHAKDPWERDRSADSPRDETTAARVRGGSKTKHKS
jgi:hypothetical protein